MTKRALPAVLSAYARVRARIDEAEEWSLCSCPFEPAKPSAVSAFQRRIGAALPPSYLAFLGVHDGWRHFWGAMWIAGVSGEARRYVDGKLAAWTKTFGRKGAVALEGGLRPDRHIVIGADDNGGFLALDSAVKKNGEREVLDMPRGFVENRWPTFAAFVEQQLAYRRRDLEGLTPAKKSQGARIRIVKSNAT